MIGWFQVELTKTCAGFSYLYHFLPCVDRATYKYLFYLLLSPCAAAVCYDYSARLLKHVNVVVAPSIFLLSSVMLIIMYQSFPAQSPTMAHFKIGAFLLLETVINQICSTSGCWYLYDVFYLWSFVFCVIPTTNFADSIFLSTLWAENDVETLSCAYSVTYYSSWGACR